MLPLKSDSHLLEEFVLFAWMIFRIDQKLFLFHLKSLFGSQDILVLPRLFGHVGKATWLEK